MRPFAVRALTALLAVTAAATVVVEVLNYRYAPEAGFALGVRTGWAMLRSLGFLILIWHVRRGRAAARPIGLILAVTTVFAVGRLVTPRDGLPHLPGLVGFAVLTALCVTLVGLLYRHPAVTAWLVRHPNRLVATRRGLEVREAAPRRPPVAGWLLTSRVAAFTYSPLMLVPALVAAGEVAGGRVELLLAVVFWLAAGVLAANVVLFLTFFLLRGSAWARRAMVGVTFGVLALHLPLCALALGVDGLLRDGAPLVAAAALNLYGLRRAARAEAAPEPVPVG